MKIRYHHLMCIPRFEGKGYSDDFCTNMQKIKDSLQANEYELTDCCDDVCAFCPNNENGICKDEEKVKRYDNKVRQLLIKGITPLPKDVCADCQWYYICSEY